MTKYTDEEIENILRRVVLAQAQSNIGMDLTNIIRQQQAELKVKTEALEEISSTFHTRDFYKELAKQALNAGKDVFVEKDIL